MKPVELNGEVTDTLAGRMVDRIGYRCRCANVTQLTQTFDAGWVHAIILLGHEDDLELIDVGVHRDEVVGQVVVDVARCGSVHLGCLVKCRAYAPDHAAHQLAAGGPRIDDMAASERADDTRHANFARARVHSDLDELGAERELNDRIYEIFGRSRADGPVSKRQFVADYLHRDDADAFEAAVGKAVRTRDALHVVCRFTRKAGGLRWLQIDGKFEATATDKPPRLVGVVADITSRKRLEARAERLSDRLLTIQEEERRSIAQELHDSTVQHLVAAALILTSLKAKSSSESTAPQDWDGLEASLEEAMKELRTFSYLMHPPALRGQHLDHSLQQYVDGFADRSGIACKLKVNSWVNEIALPLRRSMFRIVQEGLANVHRHASASKASVEIRRNGPLLHLIIIDNGRGMHTRQGTDRPARPGIGIRGIRVRLHRHGGRLRITQPVAGGTRIHAVLPLAARPK